MKFKKLDYQMQRFVLRHFDESKFKNVSKVENATALLAPYEYTAIFFNY